MHERSDALVIFGITGDLAYKKIFPALQALVRRGRLTVPVIGVARSGTLDNLIERARASLVADGSFEQAAFDKLAALFQLVSGDYNDSSTFERLRRGAGQRTAAAVLPGHSTDGISGRRDAPDRNRVARRTAPAWSSRSRSAAISSPRAH